MMRRDRGHLIAPSDTVSPSDSPSISRSPSPPPQQTAATIASQLSTKLPISKASSGTRLTGSKRALSSRSNQDSARQMMPKQRMGRLSTAGRSSSGVGRLSAVASRSSVGTADVGRSCAVVGRSSGNALDLGQSSSDTKDSGRTSAAGADILAAKSSSAGLRATAPVWRSVETGLQSSSPVVKAACQEAAVSNSPALQRREDRLTGQSKESDGGKKVAVKDSIYSLTVATQSENFDISDSVYSPGAMKQASGVPRRQSLFKA